MFYEQAGFFVFFLFPSPPQLCRLLATVIHHRLFTTR